MVTIFEGKYHQVKRMFKAVGKEVTYLKRVSMGNLFLDKSLEPGSFRKLTSIELKSLQE
jgi:16S rRNA pseudouridine516 synthase